MVDLFDGLEDNLKAMERPITPAPSTTIDRVPLNGVSLAFSAILTFDGMERREDAEDKLCLECCGKIQQ